MTNTEYKGYYITHNAYGNNEYTVQYDGDDCYFDSEDDAKKFIDELEEDHFDDKEDGIEPEDPGYDEDEVLNEEEQLNETYFTVVYTDMETGEEVETSIWGPDSAYVRRMINPIGKILKLKPKQSYSYSYESKSSPLYTTKDLALGIIDLLNSDTMDYNTGVYDKRDQALEDLINMPIFDEMSEDDVISVIEDLDYSILQKFVEEHPDQAEDMFNVVADEFGFSNYEDYKTYIDWLDSAEYDDYLKDIYDDFNDNDVASRLGTPIDEATNTGAIVNTPGKHKTLISLDEEDVDEETDDQE